MKALIYRKFGDPGVLQWIKNWPDPVLTSSAILVKTVAGGVNPKDILLRRGKFSRTLARDPLPRVSGHEIAGEVISVGSDVSNLSAGDLVFGMTNKFSGGIHSELAILDFDEVSHAPVNISLEEASAIPLAAQTALQALRDCCNVVAGQRVLINGASGGVGHFALQIAKVLGAEVHAVCGPSHQNFAASLGADVVYDYTIAPAPTLPLSFHAVFDVFGGFARRNFSKQLGTRGIYVSTVPKLNTIGGEFLARLGLNGKCRLVQVRSNAADLNQIRDYVQTNQVRPHVEKVYAAERAAAAHGHIEKKHTTGKVVLTF